MMSETANWTVRGRNALVTGGTAGIGLETALGLAREGANVMITGRTEARGQAALAKLRERLAGIEGAGAVAFVPLDLGDFRSVLAASQLVRQHFEALHVVVHNAGFVCKERRETDDGFEAMFGINHMGPFTLNRLLLDTLRASAPARIVVVASRAHRQVGGLDFDDLQMKASFHPWRAYARSKLANILFARALARRLEGSGVTVNAVHPGVVASEFGQDGPLLIRLFFRLARPFLKSSEEGAATSLFVATAPELEGVSGRYFADSRVKNPSAAAQDDALAEELWEVSNALSAGSSLPGFG